MAIVAPPRHEPAFNGPERSQLEAWLDYHRATLLVKCAGLDIEQLTTASVPPSTLTLLGLLRHMTIVEQYWFHQIFAGEDVVPAYDSPDDPDVEFNDLNSATLEEVERNFITACVKSREIVAGADLFSLARAARPSTPIDLRWICVHMIEEYARHNGHADLLRQCIDGATGD
ncbi:MAG: DinB family protein [Acidimicrobiales bacterium]